MSTETEKTIDSSLNFLQQPHLRGILKSKTDIQDDRRNVQRNKLKTVCVDKEISVTIKKGEKKTPKIVHR